MRAGRMPVASKTARFFGRARSSAAESMRSLRVAVDWLRPPCPVLIETVLISWSPMIRDTSSAKSASSAPEPIS